MFNLSDSDDFVPSTASASHLANLFTSKSPVGNASADSNNPLVYTPPKQPKQETEGNTPQQSQPKKLICVKTVQLHRLVSGVYSLVGKFGAAIIFDPTNGNNDLILYKTKQNILSSSRLSAKWQYRWTNDTVLAFKDDQSEFWSLTFECYKDIMDFMGELNKLGASNMEEPKPPQMLAEKPEEDEEIRAEILGRISKVGQSFLPKPKKFESTVSESEPEEIPSKAINKKMIPRKSIVKSRHQSLENEITQDTLDLVQNFHNTAQLAHTRFMQMSPMHSHQLIDPLSIHFAENRTHNSEIRMNLAHLTNKVECLIKEIQPKPIDEMHERLARLERVLSSQSSASRHEESENMQQKFNDLSLTSERQSQKYEKIVAEQLNQIESLKEELKKIGTEQNEAKKYKESSEESIESYEELIEKQKNELETMENKLKVSEEINKRNETFIEELQTKYDAVLSEVDALKDVNSKLQSECAHWKHQNDEISAELQRTEQEVQLLAANESSITDFSEALKDCMNKMYQNVLCSCETSKEVKKALQHNMKSATFEIIQHYSNLKQGKSTSSSSTPVPEFEVTV